MFFYYRAPIWVFPICCEAGNAQASASQSTRSLAARLRFLPVGQRDNLLAYTLKPAAVAMGSPARGFGGNYGSRSTL